MPREIKDKDEFTKLLNKATEIRVVRSGDDAKVKLRTDSVLYTFKTTSEEADSLTKGTKTPVQEINQTK